MSFWVSLLGPEVDGECAPVTVEPFSEGGTYALGGSAEANLNITYNYSPHFYDHLDAEQGLRWLDGQPAAATIERLEAAVAALGTEPYTGPYHVLVLQYLFRHRDDPLLAEIQGKDLEAPEHAELLRRAQAAGAVYNTGGYWKATPGNAGRALALLLTWARQHPEAHWRVH